MMETKLKAWNKKTISKSELGGLFQADSDAELYRLVSDAVSSQFLTPVKSSGTNGNKSYPLYLRYRITVADDNTDALSEIVMLHPAMNKTGYLSSHPELYVKFREQLQRLSNYLFGNRSLVSVSKKERSFEIFGEEKQLEDTSFRGLLDRLHITSDFLHYYETPEYCFNDYIPTRKEHMVLFEMGALSEYTRFMGTEDVKYLYWGDIDRAGLNIFLSLRKNNPGTDIRLFVPAYEEMLRLSVDRELPNSQDNRERMGDYEEIYQMFSEEDKNRLIALSTSNSRNPEKP